MHIKTVSRKGQFTIPKTLRTRLSIQPRDTVEFWAEKGGLRARPVNPVPKQPRRS
jgi:AbrB family looped-hinge helix DNA binding protein